MFDDIAITANMGNIFAVAQEVYDILSNWRQYERNKI
jgi:hypothetical protein